MTELNDTPLQNGSLEEAATPEGECLRGAHPRSSPGDPLTPPSIIAVESQHEDWAEVYQMAPTPLLTLSASGTVITANRCACELLTQPETSLRGRPFLHFICSQDRANVQERIWISGLAIERYETRLALPDGGVVPVQVGLRRSRGASGAHLLITLLELRDSKRRIPAERSARAASDARDQFMAMLSHELRTPLTPVLAAAARLRRNPALGAAARELLDMIQRNVAAEARMIDNLLDTTGILRGQLHVFKQPVELNGLLADCVEAQQEKAARKGVSISYAPAFGEYFAEGDASRLRQVFSNLLDNASSSLQRAARSRCNRWAVTVGLRLSSATAGSDLKHPKARSSSRRLGNCIAGRRQLEGWDSGCQSARALSNCTVGQLLPRAEGQDSDPGS